MRRLLKLEFLKTWNYRITRFFILAYFILIAFASLFLSQDISLLGLEINLEDLNIFDIPNVWHFITYFASILKVFLAIIIITNIANEYNYGTIKQNLIDGLTKQEFLTSKLLNIVVLSAISTLVIALIAGILGAVYSDTEVFFFTEFSYVGAYFLKLITFLTFCAFLCFLIRKSALSLALLIVWWIIEKILMGMEIWTNLTGSKDSIFGDSFMFTEYLPLEAMSNLIPAPFKRIDAVESMTMGSLGEINIPMGAVIACIIYTILFAWLSLKLIQKRDL